MKYLSSIVIALLVAGCTTPNSDTPPAMTGPVTVDAYMINSNWVCFGRAAPVTFAALVEQIGPMVSALQSNLEAFGLSLPTTKAEAMGTIMAASLAGGLTEEQKEAKSDAGLLYVMLAGSGVSDDQINAVWEAMQE